jgi:hypothetical protein
MREVREAIKQARYSDFVKEFFATLYYGDKARFPQWAVDALDTVGIHLLEEEETMINDSI